jgi:hypothetical protein
MTQRISLPVMFKLLTLLLAFAVFHDVSQAQVSLPVTSSSNATCLGQMYSDILWPSSYVGNGYYDPNGPTNFANSNEGVLGLTIFFEVRPFGYESVYDSGGYGEGGSEAMASVAATAINRSRTNNVDVSNAPGDPWIILATKDMSPSIWSVNKQGTGGLQSGMYSTLISILNGAPQTQNCNGLMYSWAMAIAASDAQNNGTLQIPQTANPTNIFPGTLFFNTDGSVPSVSSAQKPFLQELGLTQAPKYPSGAYPWYFWTITDATTFGNFPAMLY